MAKNEDSLFLLEVLIDKIVFTKSPCFSDKDFRTCVNIECPAVPPLEICDDDPGVCIAKSGGPFVKTFNNGKSCLFSLKESDISAAMSQFPVKVSVYKSLPCGCLPTIIVMGEATIDMTKEFVQARNKFLEDPTGVSYQALKDSFRIMGPDGAESGEIVMFLRISCFGKLIITKFQGGGGGGPNLGAGTSNTVVDRSCTSKRDFQTAQDPCACGAARGGSGKPGSGYGNETCASGGGGICHSARDPYNSMPCEDPDDPCYCSGPMQSKKENMFCRNTDQYCLHVPKDCCPTGNKVVFQMPSDSCGTGHRQRAHFNFTTDGVGDVARDEPGQLMPITAEDYPGVVYDFPKQVIKLRIGKTVEMPGRKSKLEYQFITPVVTHDKIIPVKDTRTAQCTPRSPCCSPRPKCAPPSVLFRQELTGERWNEISTKDFEQDQRWNEFILACICGRNNPYPQYKMKYTITECLQCIFNNKEPKDKLKDESSTSICSAKGTNISSSLASLLRNLRSQDSSCSTCVGANVNTGMFGRRETDVYLTLFNDLCQYRASGTQATAFINKCLQVNSTMSSRYDGILDMNSNYDSTCTVSTLQSRPTRTRTIESGSIQHNVYFFGRKKNAPKSAGMGYKETKVNRTSSTTGPTGPTGSNAVVNTVGEQTNLKKGASQTRNIDSTVTSTVKSVTITEDKPKKPCPAAGQTKGDLSATISHIRIGPREPCPVHGKEPCQGPKCIVASSGEQQAPVKITTVTNPRRGVFEIVIRKITGAPLAKNELMLEWTPPPSRPPPCGVPCAIPCAIPTTCRPQKCKMIVCRPSKCCKKPRNSSTCKKCCKVSCCSKNCTPCGPPPCSIPCAPPCCASPCRSPCKSSPCLRPCPVGRRRPRKTRSQPKMKANRKRTSPCLNRSKTCPVVRSRSMPSPCVGCCFIPPCPPRKCCSIAPCKPPKCCKSSCFTCCP